MTAEATAAARDLRDTDPGRASAYYELLRVMSEELQRPASPSVEPRHLQLVLDDLARVLHALDEAR